MMMAKIIRIILANAETTTSFYIFNSIATMIVTIVIMIFFLLYSDYKKISASASSSFSLQKKIEVWNESNTSI